MLLYHGDTVYVRYKDPVGDIISVVFHDIHWWYLMINDNAYSVLDYLHLNGVIDAL